VIVIGHNGSIIVFEDPPAFRRTGMTEEESLIRWHDVDPLTNTRLEQSAMVWLGKTTAPQNKSKEHID
jgi:hypothetical protein